MSGCLSCATNWGPGPQPRHMPLLGIEPMTLWFTGWHSIHWAITSQGSLVDSLCALTEVEPTTLAYWNDALTNWAMWPGPHYSSVFQIFLNIPMLTLSRSIWGKKKKSVGILVGIPLNLQINLRDIHVLYI